MGRCMVERKSFSEMACPIARSLEHVGEWWSMLILRDAFAGMTRFDQFQENLGIAPNMLTRRLGTLVDAGMLARHLYNARPPRYEYRLTPRGHDFREVLLAFMAFGNRHFAPEGETVVIADSRTGEKAEPVMIDAISGRRLNDTHFKLAAGPAATAEKHVLLTARQSSYLLAKRPPSYPAGLRTAAPASNDDTT